MPSDTAPSDTAPADTAPTDTAPTGTAPADTAPPVRAGAGARTRAKTHVVRVPVTRSAEAHADSDAGDTAPTRSSGRVRRWLPVGLALILVLILGGADVLLAATRPSAAPSASARAQLLASVKTSTALVVSYDYRHLTQDAATAESHLTGAFKTQYATAMTKTVSPKAVAQKAVVAGQVSSAGVETVSRDGRTATLLVLGQLNVTSSSQTTARSDVFRVRVTVQRVGTAWLISKIDLL